MLIDFKSLDPSKAYSLMIQSVIPRPIAWVLSDNGNGSHNLAPFSFFNGIASNPPVIILSVGWKDEQTRKDTWVNIEEHKDFVVHIPSFEHGKDIAASAATLAHGVSEIKELALSTEVVEGQRLPRLIGPKIALFCSKYAIHEIGDDSQGLILGRIDALWVDKGIIEHANGRLLIDPKKLDPLARLGGNEYARLGEVLTFKRPA